MVVRLRRVDPQGSGYTRLRRGRGFSYHDERGQLITDPKVLERLRALAVPPAWREVWICPSPHGHIQAIGTDDAGRRQYRYHDEWRRRRDAEKHDRVLRLARKLPRVREQVAEELDGRGLTCGRVLAAAVRMLDIGVFRAGGAEYAPSDPGDAEDGDGSFGLATVRREHVRLHRGAVVFCYPAKGGVERKLALRDPALHRVVGALLRRRGGGEELLAYRAGRGWRDVRAEDVNARLKELAGDEFTAKDLRTWNATVFAAVALAEAAQRDMPGGQRDTPGGKRDMPGGQHDTPGTKRGYARLVNSVMDQVAEHLGNTRAVARASYVDPRVVQRFEEGHTVLPTLRRIGTVDLSDEATRTALERAVLRLLRF